MDIIFINRYQLTLQKIKDILQNKLNNVNEIKSIHLNIISLVEQNQ